MKAMKFIISTTELLYRMWWQFNRTTRFIDIPQLSVQLPRQYELSMGHQVVVFVVVEVFCTSNNRQYVSHHFRVNDNHQIKIIFKDLNLEACYDYVELRDGGNDTITRDA